jgi:hypothetical protein
MHSCPERTLSGEDAISTELKCYMLYTLTHGLPPIKSPMKQAYLKVYFGVHCMRSCCILFMYTLYNCYAGSNEFRLQFCRWFVHNTEEPDFLCCVLWNDEETFTI